MVFSFKLSAARICFDAFFSSFSNTSSEGGRKDRQIVLRSSLDSCFSIFCDNAKGKFNSLSVSGEKKMFFLCFFIVSTVFFFSIAREIYDLIEFQNGTVKVGMIFALIGDRKKKGELFGHNISNGSIKFTAFTTPSNTIKPL